jgi:hypothetical protein
MEWLLGLGVVGAMVALRLAVPLLVMAFLVYALHRLEARWTAAAQEGRH